MDYMLSVVIPTKNRYTYLKKCVESFKNINTNNTEIVVMDNSDSNTEFIEFMNHIKMDNLHYYYTKNNLSQVENAELAVKKSSGKFVCFIGDDDSITDELVKCSEWMNRKEIDAVKFTETGFDWPDVVYGKWRKRRRLRIPYYTGRITKLDTKKILKKTVKHGAQNMKYLPGVYHAILSRDCLEKIKKKSGKYFPGESPDMANAIAASVVLEEHWFIDAPLFVSGVGYESAAGKGLRGAHKGSIKDAKQLSREAEAKWENRIPELWLGHTIWLQTMIEALKNMKVYDEYKSMINYYPMYARIFIKFPEYRKTVMKYCLKPVQRMILFLYLVRESIVGAEGRVKRKISTKRGYETDNIDDLVTAVKYSNKYLSENPKVVWK